MYILSIDQGTTSTRAIVFNKQGAIVAMAQQEFTQIYPQAGWVEHSPRDIISSLMGVIAQSLAQAGITAADIAAIGVTNQRETTVVWDKKTGEPVYNAIVWQCRRTAEACQRLKDEGLAPMIYDKTGLVVDAYFSASKIAWILQNVAGARQRAERGELAFGTIDTYVMWHLSQGKVFATDYTNAARTMLFNIHTLQWDKDLLALFDIPESMLPAVRPSGYRFGQTDERLLGAKIPLCGAVGDQQSALFGQTCTHKGDMKNTYGTGCFLLMNAGYERVNSTHGLITTLGATMQGKPPYVLEGSVFVGGAVVQWLRDELRVISKASESEKLANKVSSCEGVYVVPAFTGLGAPYWDAEARGVICGITRGTKKEHIVRACLESVAYQVNDIVQAMKKDSGAKIKTLRVDGGASKNNFLMGFQADILGCEVVRPVQVEATAAGAAYLAGLTCGYWQSLDEIKQNLQVDKTFTPTVDKAQRKKLLDGWKKAVKRARL